MLGVVADQIEVEPGPPTHQKGTYERAGTGHPHHLVVMQPARQPAYGEPPEPQLIACLLLGEVLHPRTSIPEVEGGDRHRHRMRLLLVSPAGAAQRTDQRRGQPANPDRNRPPPAPSRPRISAMAWYC